MKSLVLDEVWLELGYLLRPASAGACVRRVRAKGFRDGRWLSNSAAGQLFPTGLLCNFQVCRQESVGVMLQAVVRSPQLEDKLTISLPLAGRIRNLDRCFLAVSAQP
jgi:hypothetical protein